DVPGYALHREGLTGSTKRSSKASHRTTQSSDRVRATIFSSLAIFFHGLSRNTRSNGGGKKLRVNFAGLKARYSNCTGLESLNTRRETCAGYAIGIWQRVPRRKRTSALRVEWQWTTGRARYLLRT